MFGEVGLAGEIRAVSQAEGRIREAARLGFSNAILPQKNLEQLKGLDKELGVRLFGAVNLQDALAIAMPR